MNLITVIISAVVFAAVITLVLRYSRPASFSWATVGIATGVFVLVSVIFGLVT